MSRVLPVAVRTPRPVDLYAARAVGTPGSPMPLTLRDLLADADLGLELVGGGPDAALDVPVRWAHSSDTPDPTPWLEGGEVLLTTGLGVRDDEPAQRRLVRTLAERGCVAIGFGVGVTLADVPTAMLDEADATSMPLFTVPFEVPFIAVTRRVAGAVFDEHYATLRDAVDLHRTVLRQVTAGEGLAAVVAAAAARLPDPTLLVYDFGGQLLATADDAGRVGNSLVAEELWRELVRRHHDRDRVSQEHEGLVVTSAAVRSGAEVQAVFAIVTDEPLGEHHALLVEQAVAGISLDLARGQSVREAARVRVDELLEEVAEARASASMVERVLTRLHADPTRPVHVLCLLRPRGVGERALCSTTEDLLVERGHPAIVGRHAGDVIALAPADDADAAEALAAALVDRGWGGVVVGRSTPKVPTEALAAGLREAVTAAHSPAAPPGGVHGVDEIGVQGMLATLREGTGATTFVEQVLGPVVAYDREEDAGLVATLRAYLRHGCRPGPAADELAIHRHTLGYRLERVRELSGRDPRDGANLLELTLALALLDEVQG